MSRTTPEPVILEVGSDVVAHDTPARDQALRLLELRSREVLLHAALGRIREACVSTHPLRHDHEELRGPGFRAWRHLSEAWGEIYHALSEVREEIATSGMVACPVCGGWFSQTEARAGFTACEHCDPLLPSTTERGS